MTREDLAEKTADNLAEVSDALHTAVARNQSGQAQDYAAALRDLAAAHRDLHEDEQ